MDLPPGHRTSPLQGFVDRVQERPVPVLLQNSPAPLDRIVLTMIGRQVNQFDLDPIAIDELHHAFHELRPTTGDLRTIVEFDFQPLEAIIRRLPLEPPVINAVGDEIAGVFRVAKEEERLMDRLSATIQLEYAERDQDGIGRHVVIDRLHRFGTAGLTVPREVANLDLRLGVDGDSQRVRVFRRLDSGRLDVCEDRIGLGNFFSGRAFRTRRSRYPRRLSTSPTV
jgi:hypothetical protein